MKYSAIILAGGKSSRMRYNKEYIKIDDKYLVHSLIEKISSFFDEIIIVSNNYEHYSNHNVKVVEDILEGNSPLIGLHAGLTHSSNELNYLLACDMPNFSGEYFDELSKAISHQKAYLTLHDAFIEPFHALYSKKLTKDIESYVLDNKYGLQSFIKTIDFYSTEKLYDKHISLFRNINREVDLLEKDDMLAPVYQSFDIMKRRHGFLEMKTDVVITEFPLKLFINKKFYALIMITPLDIELMIIGYLHSNLLIKSIENISSIEIDLKNKKASIQIDTIDLTSSNKRVEIISSACTRTITEVDDEDLPKVINSKLFEIDNIVENVKIFNTDSLLFKETGGVHSVALIYDNEKIVFEDIGRHNAVDKVVGFILKNRITTDNLYIITSGRISSDILIKSAFIGIPLIVSRSAPTALAVKLAKKLDICIVGFARGERLNIYSEFSKIKTT